MTKTVYLVVRADGEVRVAKRPRIAMDEVGVRLNIVMPPGWGTVVSSVDVTMPDPPVVENTGDTIVPEVDSP